VKLKTLKAKNLFSFEELEINFVAGLHLIRGYNYDEGTANGAGKSAIIDILCWVLYGETPRSAKADEIIRWGSEGTVSAELVFTKSGVSYRIWRARRPNQLVFEADGTAVVAKDAKELQQKIATIIGFSLNTFLHSVYFPQDTSRADEFLFANDADKKEILTEILGLGVFDDYWEEVKTKIRANEIKRTKNEVELESRRSALAQKMALETKYAQLSSVFESQVKVDLENIDKVCADARNEIDRVSGIMALQDDPAQTIEHNNRRMEQAKTLLPRIADDLQLLRDQQNQYAKNMGMIEGQMKSLNLKMQNLQSIGPQCDTCLQPVSSERLKEKVGEIEYELGGLSKAHTEYSAALMDIKTKLEGLSIKQSKVEILLSQLQLDNFHLNDAFQKVVENFKRVSADQNRIIEAAEKSRVQVLARKNDYKQLYSDVRKECAALDTQIEDLIKLSSQLVVEEKALAVLNTAFGRGGIRALIFDNAIMELSNYLNEYLSQLFVGDIKIGLISEPSKSGIKTTVMISGMEISINLLSGGQKRRLILAANFALAKLISNRFHGVPNFICLDECFTGLDTVGKEKIMEFLRSMIAEKDFILVIDHATELQESFDSVYEVELRGGVSRCTYGE